MRCDWILPDPQETGRKKAIPTSFLGKKEIKDKPRRKKGRTLARRKCRPAGNSRHDQLPKLRISDRGEKSTAAGRENAEKSPRKPSRRKAKVSTKKMRIISKLSTGTKISASTREKSFS